MTIQMPDNQERFLELFQNQILKLDLAELDFGIYRIHGYRKDQINKYLTETLPNKLNATLSSFAVKRQSELELELAELGKKLDSGAKSLGLPTAFNADNSLVDAIKAFPDATKYFELSEEAKLLEVKKQFEPGEEAKIYNYLYHFFARYYADGDFLPTLKRGRSIQYFAPYNGQDVLFHWQGRHSHYIKTAEELKSYAYKDNAWQVSFDLRTADTEKDQVKGKARFYFPLASQAEATVTNSQFRLPFAFRPITAEEEKKFKTKSGVRQTGEEGADDGEEISSNGSKLQDAILKDGLVALKPQLPAELSFDNLLKHARRYARKQQYDYFAHPHLGDFLRGELDHYLFNEYLDPAAVTSPEAMQQLFGKYRALRQIALELIEFLDQLETFQSRIFEKRKFVLATRYLIRLNVLNESLWPEILSNVAQKDAWHKLFGLPLTLDEDSLRAHPTLVVDTSFFEADFTYRALACVADLDEATDGILIHGENYAALRTLEPGFEGKIKCIYIDPPYNTGNDGFIYKDEFSRHSTWLTMMAERLRLARNLLREDGVIFTSIDDAEQSRLKLLQDSVFGNENFVNNIIWQKKYSPQNDAKWLSDNHDFITCYARHKESWRPNQLPRREEQIAAYINPDNDVRGVWKPGDLSVKTYAAQYDYAITTPSGREVHPPKGRCWFTSKERFAQMVADNRVWFGPDGSGVPAVKRFLAEVKEGVTPLTVWTYQEVGHNQEGKQELVATLLAGEEVFGTPKVVRLLKRVVTLWANQDSTILDFFAGSGTTGHAIIELNREDGGRRKGILVEIGEYFDTVLLPRITRIMYCPNWKDGQPKDYPQQPFNGDLWPNWVGRSPRIIKVLQLESYEDSLNALELPQPELEPENYRQAVMEDYLIKYLLPAQTQESAIFLNLKKLQEPFEYRLNIHTPQGPQETKVDLVETFNLLMGWHVKRLHRLKNEAEAGRLYMVVEAVKNGQAMLVVWRSVNELDAQKELEFLSKNFQLENYHTIYTNVDAAGLANFQSLDEVFKRLMLERDKAVAGSGV